ncbi:MAG: transcriptional regulator [Spirochaetes bacterium]|nr:MAG: transcriptional regulator [Spirochaetota bacterium]
MEKIKEKFIEIFGNLGEGLGLNRTVCQIYALLYITPNPLSPAEIGRQLGISKGNVSINLKKLEEWEAVEKVWRKGYARSLYRANDDIDGIIFQKLKTGIEKRIKRIDKSLKNIKLQMKRKSKESDENIKYMKKKIFEIEKLIKKLSEVAKSLQYLKNFME